MIAAFLLAASVIFPDTASSMLLASSSILLAFLERQWAFQSGFSYSTRLATNFFDLASGGPCASALMRADFIAASNFFLHASYSEFMIRFYSSTLSAGLCMELSANAPTSWSNSIASLSRLPTYRQDSENGYLPHIASRYCWQNIIISAAVVSPSHWHSPTLRFHIHLGT